MSKFYPYGKQWIDDDDIKAVVKALQADTLTGGSTVAQFEKKFAETVGAKYAVAVCNGTAALHVAYAATGLTSGDTIITTPLTFAATANAAIYCGATPVFVDIDTTGNIDSNLIEEAITPSTRLLAPVHYAGQPADMKTIHEIADKHNLFVVEDACHALGAISERKPVGSCQYSDMAVFSLHPVKHITTGEGGVITTNNPDLYKKLQLLRSHGIQTEAQNWKKDMLMLGWNYRLTDFQCALGISQLSKLDTFIAERRRVAVQYDKLLTGNPSFTPLTRNGKSFTHAYHLYPVLLDAKIDRDGFLTRAQDAGIGLQVHYGLVYQHKYYRKNGYDGLFLPNAEDISARVFTMPIYPQLSNDEAANIIAILDKIAASLR